MSLLEKIAGIVGKPENVTCQFRYDEDSKGRWTVAAGSIRGLGHTVDEAAIHWMQTRIDRATNDIFELTTKKDALIDKKMELQRQLAEAQGEHFED